MMATKTKWGSFSSAWREKAFYTDPDEILHVPGPEHADKSTADPNPTWDAPADIENQADFLYDEDTFVDDWVVNNMGQVIDTTPVDHNDGMGPMVHTNDVDAIRASSEAHGRDFGASRQYNYQVPPFQDATTRYLAPRFEGIDAYGPTPEALQRGLNANPINNPDGFRRGWVDQTFVDRKMYDPERTHDRRLLTPNTAFVESDQGAVGGSYGTPFTSLARAITNISQKPTIRREPPSISESITTDGSEQQYDSQPSDWVAG